MSRRDGELPNAPLRTTSMNSRFSGLHFWPQSPRSLHFPKTPRRSSTQHNASARSHASRLTAFSPLQKSSSPYHLIIIIPRSSRTFHHIPLPIPFVQKTMSRFTFDTHPTLLSSPFFKRFSLHRSQLASELQICFSFYTALDEPALL